MASILLIRHAQASFGASDYDRLSAVGITQARLTGHILGAAGAPITRIVAGSLRRQRDTAAEIVAVLRQTLNNVPQIETDSRLDELRIDDQITYIAPTLPDPSGDFAADLSESKTSDRAYQRVIARVFRHWQRSVDELELETWPAFSARAREIMTDIMTTNARGGTTVAVSSGALIATIAQQVLGLAPEAAYGLFEVMKNCSITHFLHSGERLSLSSFNDTTYLAALGATSLITYR